METIVFCPTCNQRQILQEIGSGMVAECSRCGTILARRGHDSLARTAALSLAALILYVPANIYPILRMYYYGAYTENTIWDGCIRLFQDDQYLVAVIVFLASIVIPFFKLVGLFYLTATAKLGSAARRRQRTLIFKFIDTIGPWAMLDVFLLAILVALVRLQQLASVYPGPGLLPFASVVVLTILATASFDPKLIWEPEKEK
ncbi:MAG TPA: paraquat-inducible protein A [Candidatus Binatia bacterium]|jgi:paraquat-inducible protein A